jgi:hypothetical protein
MSFLTVLVGAAARKAQAGGDTAENYFKQTESIAGIRDARFQARRRSDNKL